MNLSGVHSGDIVKVDKRGRQFYAHIDGAIEGGVVPIAPIGRETYTAASPREVVEHYRKMGRPRPGHKVAG